MNSEDIKTAIKHGQTLELSVASTALNGLRVKPIRMSKRTANVSCEAVEARGAYLLGTPLSVATYELELPTPRPEDRLKAYAEQQENTIWELKHFVTRAEKKVAEVAASMSKDYFDFVNQMKWAYGLEEVLLAEMAQRILHAIETKDTTLEEALVWTEYEYQHQLLRNSNSPTSSNPFSNAVEITKNNVARKVVEFCTAHLRYVRNARAHIEVL